MYGNMLIISIITPSFKNQCIQLFNSNRPLYFLEKELKPFTIWLDNNAIDGRYYVGIIKGKVVACGGYFFDKEKNIAGLSWGMVNSNLHGKGLGKEFTIFRIKKMLTEYPNQNCMIETSQHTFKFYQKLGFITKKIIKDGFGKGLDNYYMELDKGSFQNTKI
jgi:hypothetical protein